MTRHVLLEELEKGHEERLDATAAEALRALDFVTVERRHSDVVFLKPHKKIGSVRVGDVQVTVRPKLTVRRLLFLLGFARNPQWRDGDVDCEEDAELIPAVVDAFARQLARAIAVGLPKEYRTVAEASTVMRGRLRTSDQLGRRLGRMSPLEIEHDEYDADTPRNRLLVAAVRKAFTVPDVSPVTRTLLRNAAGALVDVPPLSPGQPLPTAPSARGASAYDHAVSLGATLLRDRSIELSSSTAASLPAAAFTVDMWSVFQDFVKAALEKELYGRGLWLGAGKRPLDTGQLLSVEPDLLWLSGSVPVAVGDVKYQIAAEKGHTNRAVYQVLAYCLSLGLPRGYLVYAGGGAQPAVYRVGDVTVEAHGLNLEAQPSELRAQLQALSDRILAAA